MIDISNSNTYASITTIKSGKTDDVTSSTLQDSTSTIATYDCSVAEETGASASTNVSVRKIVQFNTIEIREYPRAMSYDTIPSSGGPPIGLSWKYSKVSRISVDVYERRKRQQRTEQHPQKGTMYGCLFELSPRRRTSLLLDEGYTLRQISRCSSICETINQLRDMSAKRSATHDTIEMTLRKINKGIKKIILHRSK